LYYDTALKGAGYFDSDSDFFRWVIQLKSMNLVAVLQAGTFQQLTSSGLLTIENRSQSGAFGVFGFSEPRKLQPESDGLSCTSKRFLRKVLLPILLVVVIHMKLVWMWSQMHFVQLFFTLPTYPCFDQVLCKDTPLEQERMILLQR
jgi:hypothetical protein